MLLKRVEFGTQVEQTIGISYTAWPKTYCYIEMPC